MDMFDFAVSFSSIEHCGLGRYGDPLNPFGDFEAVAQVWCMCKPGALFFFLPYQFRRMNLARFFSMHTGFMETFVFSI